MRIAVISAAFPPHRSGEAAYAYFLCLHLVRAGHEVHVLTGEGGTGSNPGMTFHPGLRRWGWGDLPRLFARLRRLRPDRVVLLYLGWTYRYHPMVNYLPWLWKRLGGRASFITLFFNYYGAERDRNGLATRLVRRLFAKAAGRFETGHTFGTLLSASDRLIALCERHASALKPLQPSFAPAMEVVPSMPCLKMAAKDSRDAFRASRELDRDAFVVAFFGLLYPGKGIETLIEAFHKFHSTCPKARLLLVGGALEGTGPHPAGYEEQIQQRIAHLGLKPYVVRVSGFGLEEDIASQALFAADVAALPFEIGIAPNNSSVAAVAHHGLPILSTEPKILEPPFENEKNVWLVPPGDATALSRGMLRLFEDLTLRHRLGQAALRLARERFSWENVLVKLL